MAEANGKIIAIVRIRGGVRVSADIKETMARLSLKHPNNCSIVKLTPSYKGMVYKCQDYVAYGDIDEPTLESLLARHAPEANAREVMQGKLDSIKGAMPIRLHPPKRGYKSTKRSFNQGGNLGNMGGEINGLIKRMI